MLFDTFTALLLLFVGCLLSQQHASGYQDRTCSDNCTCCHTEIEVADPTYCLAKTQYTDTGPASPSLLTYLCPSLPVEHRPSTTPRHLGYSGHSRPVDPLLFQFSFSVSPPTVARLASLSLPLRVPSQSCGVVLDAGFLRVYPIQTHLLRSICLATGSCPPRSHR